MAEPNLKKRAQRQSPGWATAIGRAGRRQDYKRTERTDVTQPLAFGRYPGWRRSRSEIHIHSPEHEEAQANRERGAEAKRGRSVHNQFGHRETKKKKLVLCSSPNVAATKPPTSTYTRSDWPTHHNCIISLHETPSRLAGYRGHRLGRTSLTAGRAK